MVIKRPILRLIFGVYGCVVLVFILDAGIHLYGDGYEHQPGPHRKEVNTEVLFDFASRSFCGDYPKFTTKSVRPPLPLVFYDPDFLNSRNNRFPNLP